MDARVSTGNRRREGRSRAFRFLPAAAFYFLAAFAASAEPAGDLRIVSLSGSLTETVVHLGFADRLVGVDISSRVPPEVAKQPPRVGSPRTVSPEAILAVSPNLVVAYDDVRPPQTLATLKSLGIATVVVSRRPTLDDALAKFRAIAAGLGVPERGDALIVDIRRDIAWPEALPKPARPMRTVFIQTMGNSPLQLAGSGTSSELLMNLAGAANAISGFSGYRPFNAEAMAALNPDAIVIMRRALAFAGGIEALKAMPGIAVTGAAASGRIVVVDDRAFLGLGPTLGHSVRLLREALYGGGSGP